MTHFTTDEHGNQDFHHAGWRVRIWNNTWSNRIDVTAPHSGVEVEVEEGGVWVRGESNGGWEGPSPQAFTIPWPVIAAIIEARAIVG